MPVPLVVGKFPAIIQIRDHTAAFSRLRCMVFHAAYRNEHLFCVNWHDSWQIPENGGRGGNWRPIVDRRSSGRRGTRGPIPISRIQGAHLPLYQRAYASTHSHCPFHVMARLDRAICINTIERAMARSSRAMTLKGESQPLSALVLDGRVREHAHCVNAASVMADGTRRPRGSVSVKQDIASAGDR
jgi:hypothetical protein